MRTSIAMTLCALSFFGCETKNEKHARDFFQELSVESAIAQFLNVKACDYFGITFASNMDYAGFCGIAGSRHLSKNDFKRDSLMFINNSKFIANLSDTCNWSVGGVLHACDRLNPVPLTDGFSPMSGFPIDKFAKVLILNLKMESVVKRNLNIKKIDTAAGMEHGYSEGVILGSEERITYWLIAW
jgi:hypothetical protein